MKVADGIRQRRLRGFLRHVPHRRRRSSGPAGSGMSLVAHQTWLGSDGSWNEGRAYGPGHTTRVVLSHNMTWALLCLACAARASPTLKRGVNEGCFVEEGRSDGDEL
ncbi:hypothetical protein BH24CHL4_BH24CHL4_16580 [soil metagenome]